MKKPTKYEIVLYERARIMYIDAILEFTRRKPVLSRDSYSLLDEELAIKLMLESIRVGHKTDLLGSHNSRMHEYVTNREDWTTNKKASIVNKLIGLYHVKEFVSFVHRLELSQ